MNWETLQPADLPAQFFTRLTRAAADPADPLRLAAVATATEEASPAVRTLVLREVLPRERRLLAYTDLRSAKVQHLRHRPEAAWLFYHPGETLQLRATGRVALHHHNQFARRHWEKVPPANRRNYCSLTPPGTPLAAPGDALPPGLRDAAPTADHTAAGWDHFAVLLTTLDRLDWLWLNPAGHRRVVSEWKSGAWHSHWVTP